MIEVLLASGWWLPEVCALNKSDLDLFGGSLMLDGRRVALPTSAAFALGVYLASRRDHDAALFVRDARPPRRLDRSLAWHHVRTVANKASVEGDVVSRIRRTVAARLETTQEIREALGLTGHDVARYRPPEATPR